eukprot:356456-Chlamydomonas_euryale.AAC.7
MAAMSASAHASCVARRMMTKGLRRRSAGSPFCSCGEATAAAAAAAAVGWEVFWRIRTRRQQL